MKIAVTGAGGFLGWHTRLRLAAVTDYDVVPITRDSWDDLGSILSQVDAIIHLAGVNRAEDEASVEAANIRIAEELAAAITAARRPLRVVMSGTIQVDHDNPYGRGKLAAQRIISRATHELGGAVCRGEAA